jgi:hypothetical protein
MLLTRCDECGKVAESDSPEGWYSVTKNKGELGRATNYCSIDCIMKRCKSALVEKSPDATQAELKRAISVSAG